MRAVSAEPFTVGPAPRVVAIDLELGNTRERPTHGRFQDVTNTIGEIEAQLHRLRPMCAAAFGTRAFDELDMDTRLGLTTWLRHELGLARERLEHARTELLHHATLLERLLDADEARP